MNSRQSPRLGGCSRAPSGEPRFQSSVFQGFAQEPELLTARKSRLAVANRARQPPIPPRSFTHTPQFRVEGPFPLERACFSRGAGRWPSLPGPFCKAGRQIPPTVQRVSPARRLGQTRALGFSAGAGSSPEGGDAGALFSRRRSLAKNCPGRGVVPSSSLLPTIFPGRFL